MTKESIREKYLENKAIINDTPRLTTTEKDIAHYKNWCEYVHNYGLKLQGNRNVKVY